jgi:threonine/homoserine/homoserine lactone efflux protein
MPAAASLLAFLAATIAILVVPGPSVVYVMTRSLDQGRIAGLYSMLGLETGALLHVCAACAGLTALVATSAPALTVLRYAGAAYLIYLGVRQLCRPTGDQPDVGLLAVSRRRLFRDGVLVDLLNPKTGLFFVAFLPQFIDPAGGPASVQVLVLGMCFVALAVICDSSYVMLAGRVGRAIRSSPSVRGRLDRGTGLVYLGLAAVTAVG